MPAYVNRPVSSRVAPPTSLCIVVFTALLLASCGRLTGAPEGQHVKTSPNGSKSAGSTLVFEVNEQATLEHAVMEEYSMLVAERPESSPPPDLANIRRRIYQDDIYDGVPFALSIIRLELRPKGRFVLDYGEGDDRVRSSGKWSVDGDKLTLETARVHDQALPRRVTESYEYSVGEKVIMGSAWTVPNNSMSPNSISPLFFMIKHVLTKR